LAMKDIRCYPLLIYKLKVLLLDVPLGVLT